MTKKDRQRKPFIISDRETLKIIAEPLRSHIVETILTVPHTVKQVADKLGLSPSKLYYHFNLLEQHGLIQVVETRMVANMVEKLYLSVSDEIEFDPGLLTISTEEGKDAIHTMVTTNMNTTRDDILRSLQARYFQLEQGAPPDPRQLILNRLLSRISDDQVEEFIERIKVLLQDFDQADQDPDVPDARLYAMTIAFYPSFYFDETGQSEEESHG